MMNHSNNDSDKILTARVHDMIEISEKQYEPKFIGFMDLRQRSLILKELSRIKFVRYRFFGGYPEAERVYLGVFPYEINEETFENDQPQIKELLPFAPVEISWKFQSLTHRDFLGALLSLGVKRESVGDIVVEDGKAVIFVDKTILQFVLQNLERVGKTGVKCGAYEKETVTPHHEFKDIYDTISSARADCVVAALINASRSEAERLIKSGNINVNFEQIEENDYTVEEGATVSIRGHGRFLIDTIGPLTKKGRLKFSARKYL